jgi:cytoskeletal protein CcmA (bactofilin family)
MSVLLFFVLLLGLLLLPFVPAMREVRRKADAQPLQVVQSYDVDVRYFANTFASYVEQHFAAWFNAEDVSSESGVLEDGSAYQLIGPGVSLSFDEAETHSQVTTRMVVGRGDLNLPGAMSYLNELYATGTITGADEDIYRALWAGKDIALSRASMLLRWMHACGRVQVAESCVLHGRVSADQAIQLAAATRFERLEAPMIAFGDSLSEPTPAQSYTELNPEDLPMPVKIGAGRWLIEEDVTIPDHSRIDANLIVVGALTLGDHCLVNGSIKSRKVLRVGRGCVINGSVVGGIDVEIASDTQLRGPLVSEATLSLASQCRIGSNEQGTTITAETIRIEADCLAYGAVWARQVGEVIARKA